MQGHRKNKVSFRSSGKTGKRAGRHHCQRPVKVGFVLILEAVDELLDWPLENISGTGRRVGRRAGNTPTTTVIGASFGGEGNPAYGADGGDGGFDLVATTCAKVNVASLRDEHFTQVAKGWKQNIQERAE